MFSTGLPSWILSRRSRRVLGRVIHSSRFVLPLLGLSVGMGCRGKSSAEGGAYFEHAQNAAPHGSSKLTVVFVNDVPLPAASASAALGKLAAGGGAARPRQGDQGRQGEARLRWTVPAGWKQVAPSSTMRLKQYEVTVGQDTEGPLEVAVYYFGSRGAGGVDQTFARWVSSFGTGAPAHRRSWKVSGLLVHMVRSTGAYQADTMASSDKRNENRRKDWALLGAYVDTPEGPYYFKLLGPEKLVGNVAKDFTSMLDSLMFETKGGQDDAGQSSSTEVTR